MRGSATTCSMMSTDNGSFISERLEFLDGGAGVPQHIHEDLVQPLDDGIVAPAGFT